MLHIRGKPTGQEAISARSKLFGAGSVQGGVDLLGVKGSSRVLVFCSPLDVDMRCTQGSHADTHKHISVIDAALDMNASDAIVEGGSAALVCNPRPCTTNYCIQC